jgi:predicted RNA-binding protein (virulence factor B family)
VDWGLPKELLVPNKMQKHPLEVGKSYIIHVAYDQDTDRVVGDTRIGRYLRNNPKEMRALREVEMLIVARTPMGYKVIADNRYEGMLYHDEIFEKLKIGQKRKGYVKKVRDDGKLDLSLQPFGKAKEDAATQTIREALSRSENGKLPFTYKSDPDAIHKTFGISKKAFKKALTNLIEADEITLTEQGIEQKSNA